MTPRVRRTLVAPFPGLLLCLMLLVVAASSSNGGDAAASAGHDEAAEAAGRKGPHGGRLLGDAGFSVEVSLFEQGVAPQWRVHAFAGERSLPPGDVKLQLQVRRPGLPPEEVSFAPHGDFLLGDRVAAEPHSFEVRARASWNGRELVDSFTSEEAFVKMAADVAAANDVGTATAGPRSLQRRVELTGRIVPVAERVAVVRPRYDGVVRRATGRIGDRVEAGAALAVVESSATMARFDAVSPLAGVLLDRHAVDGATVQAGDALYTVADLSTVWAAFEVHERDAASVQAGDDVVVRTSAPAGSGAVAEAAGEATAGTDARIDLLSPLRDPRAQTRLVRATLANDDGRWAPGAIVTGSVAIDEPGAAVAVPVDSLQTWRGMDVVFERVGEAWQARVVTIGRRGDQWAEIAGGLTPGAVVATGNTFLLRAEIEKAGASHDH